MWVAGEGRVWVSEQLRQATSPGLHPPHMLATVQSRGISTANWTAHSSVERQRELTVQCSHSGKHVVYRSSTIAWNDQLFLWWVKCHTYVMYFRMISRAFQFESCWYISFVVDAGSLKTSGPSKKAESSLDPYKEGRVYLLTTKQRN